MEEAFLSRTLDEWKVRLNEAGLPWAPIQNLPEVTADPQARASDFFVPFDHSSHGRIVVVANPVTGEEIVVKLSRKVTTVPCITSFVLNQSMNKISQLNFPLLTVKMPIDAGTMKE